MKHTRSAVDEAIEWTACMRSGEVMADEQKAFDAWFANPTNAQAWEKVQVHLGATFPPLLRGSDSQVRRVLQTPDLQRRRLLRGALVFGGVGIGATLIGRQSTLFSTIGADLRTATAQRGDFNLSDGSKLRLDARSAVDINFTDSERNLLLRAGNGACGPASASVASTIVVQHSKAAKVPDSTRKASRHWRLIVKVRAVGRAAN
jgi:transmembrane sensor